MKKAELEKMRQEFRTCYSIEELRELRSFLKNRMDAAEMRGDKESYEYHAEQFDEVTAAIKFKRTQLGW